MAIQSESMNCQCHLDNPYSDIPSSLGNGRDSARTYDVAAWTRLTVNCMIASRIVSRDAALIVSGGQT